MRILTCLTNWTCSDLATNLHAVTPHLNAVDCYNGPKRYKINEIFGSLIRFWCLSQESDNVG